MREALRPNRNLVKGLRRHNVKAPMFADYHTHTPLCRHAEGSPEEYIDAAIAAGLSEYGISDHAPHPPEPFDDWRMLLNEVPQYLDWIAQARDHAGDRLPVRSGLECDWLPGCQSWLDQLRDLHPWDYLIGSIHYLEDKWDFDNPKWLGRWAEIDVEAAWKSYWDEYARMAKSGRFEILGHPDLIKKFGYTPPGDLARYYDPVIEAILAGGSAIELNTAGFHKPCAEQYPSADFLAKAAQAGIPITLSSDAHAPSEVARDFDLGITLLSQAGFTQLCRFDKGTRQIVNICE